MSDAGPVAVAGPPAVAGLLLAAGAGRRMGRPKALVRDGDGTAWVTRASGVLVRGGCRPVVVVVGASASEAAALVPSPAVAVDAAALGEDWTTGMGASLRAGLAALRERVDDDVVAVLVGLVDTPGVGVEVVRRLAAVAGPDVLARAAFGGVPGHPVLLGRAHWDGVRAVARGDAGARDYLARRSVVHVECGDVADGRDVDTPEQLGT